MLKGVPTIEDKEMFNQIKKILDKEDDVIWKIRILSYNDEDEPREFGDSSDDVCD